MEETSVGKMPDSVVSTCSCSVECDSELCVAMQIYCPVCLTAAGCRGRKHKMQEREKARARERERETAAE